MSGHETSMSPDLMHTPDATKEVSLETNRTLKNVKFWCVNEGALSPMTPINPYGMGHFLHAKSYFCLSETSFLG